MFSNHHGQFQEGLQNAISLLEAGKGPTEIFSALEEQGFDRETAIGLFNQARMQKASVLTPDAAPYRRQTRREGTNRLAFGILPVLLTYIYVFSALLVRVLDLPLQTQMQEIFTALLFVTSAPFFVGIMDLVMSFFPPYMGIFANDPDVPQQTAALRMAVNYALLIVLNLWVVVLLLKLSSNPHLDQWPALFVVMFAVSRLWALRFAVCLFRCLRIALGFPQVLGSEVYPPTYRWVVICRTHPFAEHPNALFWRRNKRGLANLYFP